MKVEYVELVQKLREIHKPFGIYDECDHDHGDGPGDESPSATVVDVDGIGLTCNLMYSICTNCCAFGGDLQSEECAGVHDHGPGKPICATAVLLDEPSFICPNCGLDVRYNAPERLAACCEHAMAAK